MDTVDETNCEVYDDKARAQALGEAMGIPSEGLTEAEVARKACSAISNLKGYADHGTDAEVLAAIRGYIACMVIYDEDPDEELDDEAIDEIIYGDLYKDIEEPES